MGTRSMFPKVSVRIPLSGTQIEAAASSNWAYNVGQSSMGLQKRKLASTIYVTTAYIDMLIPTQLGSFNAAFSTSRSQPFTKSP